MTSSRRSSSLIACKVDSTLAMSSAKIELSELGGGAKILHGNLVIVFAEIHRTGKGRSRARCMPCRQQGRNAVVGAIPFVEQFGELEVGEFHRRFFFLARLAFAVIEVIDIHVVVVQRPACRLRLGEIGIAVCRVNPGAADVKGQAKMLVGGPGSPTDPAHRFENAKTEAGSSQYFGCGKTG